MSIIGSLPDTLTNGTTADASQVMADLNFIVNQVNANANPIGTFTAPSGTRMPFNQAAAPAGWVTDTTLTDHLLWISAAGGGQFNSSITGYSNFINGTWNAGGHALALSEMPNHTHGVNDPTHTHAVTDPGHQHTPPNQNFWTSAGGSTFGSGASAISQASVTAAATTGISNQAAGTGIGIQYTGGNAAHVHPMNQAWNFAGHIVAQKS